MDRDTLSADWRVTLYRVELGREVGEKQYASIWVWGDNEEQQLWIYFMYPDVPLPDNTTDGESGTLYVPAEHFSWYIDLLRNEDPVRAELYGSPIKNRLTTDWEPVGGGELPGEAEVER